MARGLGVRVGTLPVVDGDARQLYQALVVLVPLVAADSDRGTTITIGASHHRHEWQLHIGTRPAPGHAAGAPGRPTLALLPGIELMIAQRVAEAHDGRVWSDDPADGGHTLHLSIADAVHHPAAAARPTGDVHDLRPAG